MTPAETSVSEHWLIQQDTQIVLTKLKNLHRQKLVTASRQAQSPSLSDVNLRLLLREASVVEEIYKLITNGKEIE